MGFKTNLACNFLLLYLTTKWELDTCKPFQKYDCRLIIGLKQVPVQWSPFLHVVLFYLFRILRFRELFSTRACITGSTKIVISPPLSAKLWISSNIRNNLKLSQSYYVQVLHLSEINLPPAYVVNFKDFVIPFFSKTRKRSVLIYKIH